MGVWVYLRHYINLSILYAVLTTFRTIGPFELNWDTQQYKCWISQYITFALLVSLQSINLFWLYFIVRIAVNAVLKEPVTDVRSDDEAEEEDEETKKGLQRVEGGNEEFGVVNGHATQRRVGASNGNAVDRKAGVEVKKKR